MDLSVYYEEICRQPFLTREEEVALFGVINDDTGLYTDKEKKVARDRIITANLRFVFQKAKKRSKGDPDQFEELIAAGNEGLLKALPKYDVNSGTRFLTYAGWWVLQSQMKEMSQMRTVSIPIWKQQLSARIIKAQAQHDYPLTASQLHELFPDESYDVIKELSQTRYLTYYLDDLMEDNPCIEEVHFSYCGMTQDDLMELCVRLGEPHSTVVLETFGMITGKDSSLSATAERMGITREEARKIRREALQRLRDFLIGDAAGLPAGVTPGLV